jgi:hypothetical protein
MLSIFWAIATSVGLGLGWHIALQNGTWLLIGLALSVMQGLVLIPWRWISLWWVLATTVGWAVSIAAMWLLSLFMRPMFLSVTWVTVYGHDIAWAAGLTPFVAVPIISFAQWLVLRHKVPDEHWILWIGVSFCSFPVAGFFTLVLGDVLSDRDNAGGLRLMDEYSLMFWVLGGLWGVCTGWALGSAQRPLSWRWRYEAKWRMRLAYIILVIAAAILLWDHALPSFDLIWDDAYYYVRLYAQPAPLLVIVARLAAYAATGFIVATRRNSWWGILAGILMSFCDYSISTILSVLASLKYGDWWIFSEGRFVNMTSLAFSLIVGSICGLAGASLAYLPGGSAEGSKRRYSTTGKIITLEHPSQPKVKS